MSRKPADGERTPGSEATVPAAEEPAVRARLEKIRREKRGRVRWNLSRHTAEQALIALTDVVPPPERRPSSKGRRRKRRKRLL
jgi:hypothetical protein